MLKEDSRSLRGESEEEEEYFADLERLWLAAGGGSVFGFACCCLVEAKRTTKIAELRTILSASAAPP